MRDHAAPPPVDPAWKSWVQELAPGNPEPTRATAWREVVDWLREHHLERLLRSIRRRARDLDPLEVLHEFYLGFHRSPPRDPDRLRLEFRVLEAARRIRAQQRSRLPSARYEEGLEARRLLPAPEEAGQPERAAELSDCARELHDLVGSLEHPRHREVARLRFVEGLTLKQVAAALELPLGTVKSDLAREIQPRFQSLENRWAWQATLKREGRA